jgi:hypothetical protein
MVEPLFLSQANFKRDCCIVLASEGYGISPAVLAACDEAAAIPMKPRFSGRDFGVRPALSPPTSRRFFGSVIRLNPAPA